MIRHRYNLNGERDARRGFTLVELLVVIVILGVLTAIAAPIYLNQRVVAWKATVVSDVHNAAKQVELASYHGDGSLTQLSSYHAARTVSDDTDGGSSTIPPDKTFSNADGKYDGHGTIGSEPVPVSTGNTLEVQAKSDNSYTIYGVSTHVNGWVYRYESARRTGEWERGSYLSDPTDPSVGCAVVLDGTRLIIGKDGMRCKLSTDMVNEAFRPADSDAVTRDEVTKIDLHGHVVIVDGSKLFYKMPSLTSIPYLPGQSVTSSVNGVSYSGMFSDDYKLADADSISHWDTSNVTDMSWMFAGAISFNQPISNFDTSKVTSMSYMFNGTRSFNQSVSKFNTSKVTNMDSMFGGAISFNQSVSNFVTSNVTSMSWMFHDASSFNQPVPFDTRNVMSMNNMFHGASSFNRSVSSFDTRKVTNMSEMFHDASSFNQSVSNFDTSNVTSIYGMFRKALSFNQSVSNFDTRNVTNMNNMFNNASSFNQDLTGWNVTNFAYHYYFSDGSALTAAHLPHFTS